MNSPATKWTGFMDNQLRALWPNNSCLVIARIMGLTDARVARRARKLKLKPRTARAFWAPTRQQWISAARMVAALENIGVREIIEGGSRREVSHARWRAFKAVLDTDSRVSIAGLARVSGFDHTGILHGLMRLKGGERSAIGASGRATGRRPKIILQAAE